MFISSDTAEQNWSSVEEQYAAEELEQEFYYGKEELGSTSEYPNAYEEDPQYLQRRWF